MRQPRSIFVSRLRLAGGAGGQRCDRVSARASKEEANFDLQSAEMSLDGVLVPADHGTVDDHGPSMMTPRDPPFVEMVALHESRGEWTGGGAGDVEAEERFGACGTDHRQQGKEDEADDRHSHRPEHIAISSNGDSCGPRQLPISPSQYREETNRLGLRRKSPTHGVVVTHGVTSNSYAAPFR
jgi:hypothetical protein